MTYHGVESCGLDRGNVARNGGFCPPCGRTTATANCPQGRFDPFGAPFGNGRYLRIPFSNGVKGGRLLVVDALGCLCSPRARLALDGVS